MGRGSIFFARNPAKKFEQEVTGMTDFNQKTHDTDVSSDSWTFRLRKNHIFEDVKWSFGAGARCECVRQNYVGGGGYPQSIHGRVEKKCGTGVSDTGTVSVFYL